MPHPVDGLEPPPHPSLEGCRGSKSRGGPPHLTHANRHGRKVSLMLASSAANRRLGALPLILLWVPVAKYAVLQLVAKEE
jgi:hypothetical protein